MASANQEVSILMSCLSRARDASALEGSVGNPKPVTFALPASRLLGLFSSRLLSRTFLYPPFERVEEFTEMPFFPSFL